MQVSILQDGNAQQWECTWRDCIIHLKMVKMINLMFYIFFYSKKKIVFILVTVFWGVKQFFLWVSFVLRLRVLAWFLQVWFWHPDWLAFQVIWSNKAACCFAVLVKLEGPWGLFVCFFNLFRTATVCTVSHGFIMFRRGWRDKSLESRLHTWCGIPVPWCPKRQCHSG